MHPRRSAVIWNLSPGGRLSSQWMVQLLKIWPVVEAFLGRNLVALTWIAVMAQRPWKWWKFFRDIDVLIEQIKSIQFKLIPREKNNLADFLAKAGLQRSSFLKAWW
ncbi:hypothetical protein GQ457_16G016110 [Hibiscus cannabinus]